MQDILRAYQWWEQGQLQLYAGDDPPHILVEGVSHYSAALNVVRAHDQQQKNNG